MGRVRYAKSPEQLKSLDANPEFLRSTVRSIRAAYETDAAVVAAVLPRPLEPPARPEVWVTFSHVTMHLRPELSIEIGSGVFGVRARYDGQEGTYLLTMPMTTEQAVVGGRETYGEPKKIAEIGFEGEGERVAAYIARMGITYLEVHGRAVETLPAREYTDYAWCFKALPACENGRDFDGEPLLVRLEWRQRHEKVERLEGELVLRDSPFDPVADLPIRRLLRLEYDEGSTQSNGRVLRSVPGHWLLPFLHQRYDDPSHPGIEV